MLNNKQKIVEELQKAYWSEIETVMNYLAHSTNLDGVSAEEIKEKLSAEINDELEHAKMLAARIKQLDGLVNCSDKFTANQKSLQSTEDTTDVSYVINGVLDAEKDAIETYRNIINITDGDDHVTQDLATQILADEESHKTIFEGFKKEYETTEV
jgi:bacterioferritin